MSDKEILDIFITKKGKINPNLCRDRWLNKHLDIMYSTKQEDSCYELTKDIIGLMDTYISVISTLKIEMSL